MISRSKIIYVAGKWQERLLIKRAMNELKKHGFKIAIDWTVHEDDSTNSLTQYAIDDLEAVKKADCLVAYVLNPWQYKGLLVEIGAALALNKPIYILGSAIDSCVFVNHSNVYHVNSLDELIEVLVNMNCPKCLSGYVDYVCNADNIELWQCAICKSMSVKLKGSRKLHKDSSGIEDEIEDNYPELFNTECSI